MFICRYMEILDDFYNNLSLMMSGVKGTVVKEKQEKGLKLDEGKEPMSLSVYTKICEILYSSDRPESNFVHFFLTLEWNLMTSSDSCVISHVNHIQWRDDSLIMYFSHTKTDQGGVNMRSNLKILDW